MNRYLLILGVWLVFGVACDPCGDCGEPLIYDPTVRMVFINQDSLNTLNDSLTVNKDSIETLGNIRSALADSISVLGDTIESLQELVDEGQSEYQDDLNYFSDINDSLEVVRDSVSSYSSQISSLNSEINKVISTINGGSVQLTKVTLLNNGTELTFEDSATSFALPLLLGTVGGYTESNYEITIVDTVFNLDFRYETFETIDEARVARVRARDLAVLDNDTVNIRCNSSITISECVSDETTVTVYF